MPPRFFKHGELPLVLLALLSETPRHGYDIMAELTRLFGPRYRASPGSIYPAMEALQTEGLLEGTQVADKIVYTTTPAGEHALDERADMLAALELRVGVQLGGESLEAHLTRFKARLLPLSGRIDPNEASKVLARAAIEIEFMSSARPTQQRKHHAR